MPLLIRPFKATDVEYIVEILKRNGQYDSPTIEGPEAMTRVAECDAAVFLVADIDSIVAGCIRATYDGSRAMIHLLSVHPEYQGQKIGSKLVESIIHALSARGSPTISVTVTDSSEGFWLKLGFEKLPVFLMLKSVK